jgi:uncharacterized protein with ParB-like and HNH nuclease domain
MSESIELKSISELLNESFYIPSYQRGYRWAERQIVDLLEDINEFDTDVKLKKNNSFYCLQPIVVKKSKNPDFKWDVIDGQQRLTTIYLILKSAKVLLEADNLEPYKIGYETRKNSQTFLESELKIDESNIDFFHISRAFKIINDWFKNNKIKKSNFINRLLEESLIDDGIDKANNVRVIWYEIDNKNEIDVFTRLNIGKIPLTNAELIKALFLINIGKNNESEKILLASQWDDIEYKLQDKEFFAFINGEGFDKPTKIEYIFDVMAKSKYKDLKIDNLTKDDGKHSFYVFNELIKDEESSKKLWDEVKTYFRIFNELHTDNTYYHLVGYLVNNKEDIGDISKEFLKVSKKDFLEYLKKEIALLFKFKKDKTLENIEYEKDYELITKILFLFNVISTMNSEHSRYPFNLHKQENWSLEHIHPQNPETLTDNDKKELLESYKEYASDELKTEIDNSTDDKNIDELLEKIREEQGDNKDLHLISNMALLSKEKNSSLGNDLFIQKRKKIIEWDKDGKFIPIATKNVFLKYYTDKPQEMKKWNKKDRKAYLNAIKKTLIDYIGEK